MGATICRRDALVVFERAEDAAIVLSELAEFDLGGRTVRVVRVGGGGSSSGGVAAPAAGSHSAFAPVAAPQSPPPTAVASEPSTPSESGVALRPDRSTSNGFHYSDHGGEDTSSTSSTSSEPAEPPPPLPAKAVAGAVAPAAVSAAPVPYDRYASNYGATFSGVDGPADDATRNGGDALAPAKKYGVWVGYFPEGRMIDRRAVMQIFSTLGQVHSVVVPKDPVTGRYGCLPPGGLAVRAEGHSTSIGRLFYRSR